MHRLREEKKRTRMQEEKIKMEKCWRGKFPGEHFLENEKVVCKFCARREARQRVGASRASA